MARKKVALSPGKPLAGTSGLGREPAVGPSSCEPGAVCLRAATCKKDVPVLELLVSTGKSSSDTGRGAGSSTLTTGPGMSSESSSLMLMIGESKAVGSSRGSKSAL